MIKVSRQTRIVVIIVALLALLATVEYVFETWQGDKTVILIENLGTSPIENLVLRSGGSKSSVGSIAPGATTRLFVSGSEIEPLTLTFEQAGNPLKTLELPDYTPSQLVRDNLMLNIKIRPNGEIERFGDQNEEAGTPVGRILRWLKSWFVDSTVP